MTEVITAGGTELELHFHQKFPNISAALSKGLIKHEHRRKSEMYLVVIAG